MKFAPVPAREHAIVWEIRPQEARGALFDFGAEQRIVLNRTWQALRGEPLPSFLKLKQFRRVPVVVALHPALARTFILPFRLARKKSEAPLQPEQLQAMLRDFLAKTTFEMRRLAGDELGVEELDAIILDARLARLLADGAEVRDDRPVAARRVEGFLQVTLTTRAVFHDLHDLLHSGREVFFTERGPAALAFLARHLPGPLALLDLEAEGGWLLRMDPDAEEVVKKTAFKWRADGAPAALAATWGVSKKTADELYAVFLRGGFSDHLARWARKVLEPLTEAFERTLERALAKGKTAERMHLRAIIPPPFKLPGDHAGVELAGIPLNQLLEASGLAFDLPAGGGPGADAEISFLLLPFLEYYYHRGDAKAHKALTRHIHWIAA